MAQDSKSSVVLAEIDLSECSAGKILDYQEPDKRVEEKVFKGWNNALEWGPKQGKRPSSYRVVRDGEVQVLEHDYQRLAAWDGKSGNALVVCVRKSKMCAALRDF